MLLFILAQLTQSKRKINLTKLFESLEFIVTRQKTGYFMLTLTLQIAWFVMLTLKKLGVTICLKHIYQREKLWHYNGLNKYWIMDNSKPILGHNDNMHAMYYAITITTLICILHVLMIKYCVMGRQLWSMRLPIGTKNKLSGCLLLYHSTKENLNLE